MPGIVPRATDLSVNIKAKNACAHGTDNKQISKNKHGVLSSWGEKYKGMENRESQD